MLMTRIPTQLADIVASSRLAVGSFVESVRTGMELVFCGPLSGGQRRRPAVIPVTDRSQSVYADRTSAIVGFGPHAAVPMYADPVIDGWRALDFANTDAGETGHPQPSRFAP